MVVYVLVLGITFAWLLRRIGLIDVVGYIIGGMLLAVVMESLGRDLSIALSYTELVSWIGLVLFSFRVGASISLRLLSASFMRLIASELAIILIQWVVSGFITLALGFDLRSRVALFFVLINSSSIAVLAIERMSVGIDVRGTAYMQTQMEDLIQFTLFSIFTAIGLGGLSPGELLLQIVKVSALIMLLIYISRYMLKFLSRSPLMAGKEGKFFTSIAFTLISTSIATLLGLPPLFGAFVSGIAFSLFLDLSDIVDRLDGLKDLGLLFYFSSLGFQFYLGLKEVQGVYMLMLYGTLIGVLAFISRALGVFMGSLLSGYSLETCAFLSLFLTPLSEVGLMFINTLAKQGFISMYIVHMLMISLLTSLTIFSIATPRLAIRVPKIIELVPNRVSHFINIVSREYTKRLSVLSSALLNVIIFAFVALIASYVDTVVKYLVDILHLPKILSALSTIASAIAIMAMFIITMRRTMSSMFKIFSARSRGLEALSKLFDMAIGCLAIALQIQILHDFASRYVLVEPLNILVVAVVLATIAITLYDLLKTLRPAKP